MHEKKKRKKGGGGGIAGNFKEVYLYNAPLFWQDGKMHLMRKSRV